MKLIRIIISSIFIFCLGIKTNAQYITIDDTKSAQELVQSILINSSCASVSDAKAFGDTYTPGKKSYAYFNAGTSNFPFKEGVLLSTYTSNASAGPFDPKNISGGGGSPSWLGDSDLNQILNINSINSTILEFDFEALTNFISFNYIFASNEYRADYPCRFSDGFAFLIKEKDGTEPYKNLATLPNSNTPVSSMTVHPKIESFFLNGSPIDGCPPENEIYFNGYNTASSPINYAAQTIVMKSEATVVSGNTYHIKLVIADDRFQYYDSAIFLEAGSFKPRIDIGEDRTLSANNPMCYGDELTLDTSLSLPPGSNTYQWYKNDVEIPGAEGKNFKYTVKEAGTYRVKVIMSPSTCETSATIKIEYAPEIVVANTTLVQCDIDADGFTAFNLTKADAIIKNNDATLSVVYYKSLADAQAKLNPIANPTSYINNPLPQIIHARVENKYGCPKYAELELKIAANVSLPQHKISVCDEDTDGLYIFNLKTQVTPQLLNGLPSELLANYYLSESNALAEINPLPNNFKNTIPLKQTIYARIINGPECYAVTPIELIINVFDPANFGDETVFLCKDATINLSVATGFKSYKWNPTGLTSNTISVNSIGTYSVTVTDENDCEKTKKFNVIASDVAVITDIKTKDFSGNENSVLIEYRGIGNYEFSLDNTVFQDNPLFQRVLAGVYNAYVRDKNGCGTTISETFYVLDYPRSRFFTPNGDGFNDVWRVKNLEILPDYSLSIFDRYGKLLKQMNSIDIGWNGTYNGHELPADDYWFVLKFVDGKEIKGHFSLKR